MTRRVLYFETEPRGSLYRRLLLWLLPRSDEFLLVVRDMLESDDRVRRALAMLRGGRISVEDVSEWPGTKISGSAELYRFRCNTSSVAILSELAGGLFDWKHPALPEDLCFLTSSGRAILVSVSHEREAYLDLAADERHDLMMAIPELRDLLSEHVLPKGW